MESGATFRVETRCRGDFKKTAIIVLKQALVVGQHVYPVFFPSG